MPCEPEEVSPNILKYWIDNDFALLVDVREPDEYAAGHIEGAVHIPLSTFDRSKVPEPGDRHLVFQCRAGGRSMKAATAWAAGADEESEVFSLAGGITAWEQAGYPVKK